MAASRLGRRALAHEASVLSRVGVNHAVGESRRIGRGRGLRGSGVANRGWAGRSRGFAALMSNTSTTPASGGLAPDLGRFPEAVFDDDVLSLGRALVVILRRPRR
jgi:hypothetical protein